MEKIKALTWLMSVIIISSQISSCAEIETKKNPYKEKPLANYFHTIEDKNTGFPGTYIAWNSTFITIPKNSNLHTKDLLSSIIKDRYSLRGKYSLKGASKQSDNFLRRVESAEEKNYDKVVNDWMFERNSYFKDTFEPIAYYNMSYVNNIRQIISKSKCKITSIRDSQLYDIELTIESIPNEFCWLVDIQNINNKTNFINGEWSTTIEALSSISHAHFGETTKHAQLATKTIEDLTQLLGSWAMQGIRYYAFDPGNMTEKLQQTLTGSCYITNDKFLKCSA